MSESSDPIGMGTAHSATVRSAVFGYVHGRVPGVIAYRSSKVSTWSASDSGHGTILADTLSRFACPGAALNLSSPSSWTRDAVALGAAVTVTPVTTRLPSGGGRPRYASDGSPERFRTGVFPGRPGVHLPATARTTKPGVLPAQ
jgi:hypothetical protein